MLHWLLNISWLNRCLIASSWRTRLTRLFKIKMQLRAIKRQNATMQEKMISIDKTSDDLNSVSNEKCTVTKGCSADPVANMSLTSIVVNCKNTTKSHLDGMETICPSEKLKPFRDDRLVFNICGAKYEVLKSTVQRYPNTMLADAKRRMQFWDEYYQEYFLDRNRDCFESVLTYYQSSGILIRPQNIPDVLFLKELEFYDLGEDVLRKVRGTKEGPNVERQTLLPENKLQLKIWNLFEHPETSTAARFIAWLSCAVVLLSIVMFCVETLPEFRKSAGSEGTTDHKVFFTIEAICIAWFTFEYIIRLLSSPNKCTFVKEPLNVIDLIAILPFFMAFALSNESSNVSSMAILRAVRLVRVFRIFKLSRYSTGLQILGMTLKASMGELGLLVFFLSVGVVLFASAIYYAEMSVKDGAFHSIPHSFWWAIVTMTTVGYGDMYPTTYLGKVIGSVCACTGILAIALPVPVIVANFERFYSKSQEQAKENSKEKQKKAAKHKALKRFFDRLRNRDSEHMGESGEQEYFDMGASVGEEMKANSEGSIRDSLVVEKDATVVGVSSV